MIRTPSRAGRILLTLVILGATALSAFAAYDRQAAVDYALAYWDKVCSDGFYFAETSVPLKLTPVRTVSYIPRSGMLIVPVSLLSTVLKLMLK